MSKTLSPKPAANQAFPFALLEEGLVKLDLDGAEKAAKSADRVFPLLTRYIEEIELFNPAYGLVKVQDRRELIVKHILDSLAPLCVIRRLLDGMSHNAYLGQKTSTIADVGSGSGLPGIPLAICMPDVNFTLVERMGRRAGFLRNVLAVLGIPNVRVEETEMEKFTSGASGFDLVVFRAFRPLEPAILKGLFRLVKANGKLAAYKGRREAIEEEMAQAFKAAEKNLSPPIGAWEAVELEVPFLEEERHLLIMECPIAEAVGQVP